MSERVSLSIGGQLYEGWTEIRISRAIDTMVGEFELTLTERARQADTVFPFRAGASCELQVEGETLITGWIDRLEPSLDPRTHSIKVSGRDRAADLIDCAATNKPGSWRNAALETIAAELAKPFGITITAKASTAPRIKRFALQQGESVQSAIERLCRYRGLLAVSTREGQVELINPGQGAAVADLVEGQNLTTLSASHDVSDRYSDYILKGQASGDDDVNGKAAAGPTASAKDPAVTRYRPLVIIGEEQSDITSLTARAKWEATTRAGRAQSARVTTPGWRRSDGKLWEPDCMVNLTAPTLYMQGKMMVAAVELLLDNDEGEITALTLYPPEAYSQLPISEKADASAIKGA